MIKKVARVNGMQHIGIAVSDMDVMLPLYRKLFGLDSIPEALQIWQMGIKRSKRLLAL